jgi:hypothetical protein
MYGMVCMYVILLLLLSLSLSSSLLLSVCLSLSCADRAGAGCCLSPAHFAEFSSSLQPATDQPHYLPSRGAIHRLHISQTPRYTPPLHSRYTRPDNRPAIMSRKPPRKFRRPLGRRKSHVSNPRSRMVRSRKNTLWKGLGLDDLVATSSMSPSSRRASKYSNYAAIPSSAEPLEEVGLPVQETNIAANPCRIVRRGTLSRRAMSLFPKEMSISLDGVAVRPGSRSELSTLST